MGIEIKQRSSGGAFRRIAAGFAIVGGLAGAAIATTPGMASAVPGCPSGSDGSTTHAISGISLAKACFRWDDRKAIVQDIHVDSISARIDFIYYNAGWVSGRWWDSNGANNGWEYSSSLAANRSKTVGVRACSWDKNGSSGRYDYGCTAQKTINPQVGA